MIQDQIKELLHISMWNVLRKHYQNLNEVEREKLIEDLEELFRNK